MVWCSDFVGVNVHWCRDGVGLFKEVYGCCGDDVVVV